MTKIVRTYLMWAAIGAIASPLLCLLYATCEILQVEAAMTFSDAFREVLRTCANEEHLGIIVRLVMACGAIMFVAIRVVIALFARTFCRPQLEAANAHQSSSVNDDSQTDSGRVMFIQPAT